MWSRVGWGEAPSRPWLVALMSTASSEIEAMAAVHEFEAALGLPDAAVAPDEDAHAEDIDEDAVQPRGAGEPVLEELGQPLDEGRRIEGGGENGNAAGLSDSRWSSGGTSRSRVTTTQHSSRAISRWRTAARCFTERVLRYEDSLPPRIWTRPGLRYRVKPVRASPGLCTRDRSM